MADTKLVSRRTLLLGSLATGAALAAAGGVVGAVWPAPAPGLAVLTPHEASVVRAVAEAYFPAGVMPASGPDAGVVEAVDEILDDWLPAHLRLVFRYMLRAVEWGALTTHGQAFSSLSVAARQEILTAYAAPGFAPRRLAADALKMTFGIAYFGNPAVRAAIGWRNACSGGVA